MKLIGRLQFCIFILACGFIGGWECGSVTGTTLLIEILFCGVGALLLQLLKIRLEETRWHRR